VTASSSNLLTVDGLTVEFPGSDGHWVPVVEDVSFSIGRGEITALVGESGSGKSVTALGVLGLLPLRGGRIASGSVQFEGIELVGLNNRAFRRIRGNRIGMIFQQPVLTLNPAYTVGEQIAESVRTHLGLGRKAAWARAVEMLRRVEISQPESRAKDYPHMFSGGMCQRVMIAQALSCEPDLLIADEPTTALDVTIQATILELLRDLQADTNISILLITHDFGVVAEMADKIVVLYAGQVVERAEATAMLLTPRHPYTDALLGAIPTETTRRLTVVPGTVPTPGHIPAGCRFSPRCTHFEHGRCDVVEPPLISIAPGRESRCIRVDEIYPVTSGQAVAR
jgi:oligopeptide/dipeptide ABC transporter ATP-binding protein